MPIFLLIRHAENEFVNAGRLAGRFAGVHLNENGHLQVKALAEKLAGVPVKAVYASPLARTMETAKPIAAALDQEVIPCDGLLEVDFGEWQGKTLKSLRRRKLWKVVQAAPSQVRFPGGESFAEAQLRIVNELKLLAQKYKPKDIVLCITHSDMIKLAAAYFIGLPLDMFQRLHISTASITGLKLDPMGGHLLSLNYDISCILPKH
ncbi:MAG: histidine phosphatase family protein [Chloroflexota bacterium]|nr:histidine phosphatase family protein [Chloroflexota bacterium]